MLEILLISAGAVLETLFIMRSYKRRDSVEPLHWYSAS